MCLLEICQRVFGFLYAEKIVIALMVTSAVKTFPVPGQPFNLYTFFYDWTHQFFNITNIRQSPAHHCNSPEATASPTSQSIC